jgi:hypothetical protein
MLTWTERRQGSPIEHENAQKRILEVFTQWKAPSRRQKASGFSLDEVLAKLKEPYVGAPD